MDVVENPALAAMIDMANGKGYSNGQMVEACLLVAAHLCEQLGVDLTPEERAGAEQTGRQLGERFYEGGPYVVAGALRVWAKRIMEEDGHVGVDS